MCCSRRALSCDGTRHVVVQVIVGVVVDQVTDDEARVERVSGIAESGTKGEQEEDGERDADRRWHDQPQPIVGMIVVDAVHDEVEATAQWVIGLPVEDETMQPETSAKVQISTPVAT